MGVVIWGGKRGERVGERVVRGGVRGVKEGYWCVVAGTH